MYLVALGLAIFLQNVSAVLVSTQQGILRGEKVLTVTGDIWYYSFKGIPYASPPIGSLRFKEPQPPASWEAIRNATAHGNICPQFDRQTNVYITTEDCLFLNVYTPRVHDGARLPVIVVIHGGGYVTGSGNDDYYGPDFLIKEDIVLVTMNYRLGPLGFMCLHSKEVPGNMGLKDQVAALKWVQRNIKSFGGDPGRVTVLGESAGGCSCTLLAVSPLATGLFHRMITMSGAPATEFSVEFKPKQRAFTLAKILGFETENTTELFRLLQNEPVRNFLNTNSSVITAEDYMGIVRVYFVPVIEKDFGQKRFLEESPEVAIENGRMNDVDVLLGYTSEEALAFVRVFENSMIKNYNRYRELLVPRNIFYRSTPDTVVNLADIIKQQYFGPEAISVNSMKRFVDYVTDIYIYNVIRYARQLSKFNYNNRNMYLYEFSCVSELNGLSRQGAKYGVTGVAHTDDLRYLFQANQYNFTLNKNATSYKMVRKACALFANFAKFGNPTPDQSMGAVWPRYDARRQRYLDIGEQLTVSSHPKAAMMEFWESIYCEAGLPF